MPEACDELGIYREGDYCQVYDDYLDAAVKIREPKRCMLARSWLN